MRRSLPITVAFVIVLAVTFPNFARGQGAVGPLPPDLAPLDAPDPKQNMALGGGKYGDGFTVFVFNLAAHSGPLGENPRGHIHVTAVSGIGAGIEVRGDVTCLTVVGNTATLGGMITDLVGFPEPFGGFHGFWFTVQDNGNPQQVPRDMVGNLIFFVNPPLACPLLGTGYSLTEGDIVVRSALP